MIGEGVPDTPPSRISKTAADELALPARFRSNTQKSGEVMISLRRGPGSLIHDFRPCRTSCEVLPRISLGMVEIVCNRTGARTKSCSYIKVRSGGKGRIIERDAYIACLQNTELIESNPRHKDCMVPAWLPKNGLKCFRDLFSEQFNCLGITESEICTKLEDVGHGGII